MAALRLMEENNVARNIFQVVADRLGESGWAVAKSVNENPDEVAKVLDQLGQIGLVRATEPGLEGNYSLTGLGFDVKEQIASRRFSRGR
jgi:DNA-binding IscR family transcriptional regulator